ncbi:MAG TPA: methyltransferase, partial [Myxococcota bacterium]|nr:methyltransferase [Myxococcota bacterium]
MTPDDSPTVDRARAQEGDPPTALAALAAGLGAFGARLALRRPPLCPEIELWLLHDDVDLEAGCQELAEGEAPPFWAFCWASGQALAR